MCGIAGCVAAPGATPDRDALAAMGAALHHRGPDDAGIEIAGSVGLVHRRLSIVDPTPAGHQPMTDEHRRWWLAYNGEIFNHRELRATLGPVAFRGGTDSETLLQLLCAEGEAAIPRCNGLFAFAALDTAGQRLLLARDRWGVKPLYVARHAGALWFASEIRALLAAGIPRRADAGRLRHAVFADFLHAPEEWVEGVSKVLPGHLATVDLRTLELRHESWYEPRDVVSRERGRELAAMPRERLGALLEETLRAAVRRRLMSDVPLGTMCSGGLDSSLITAFARDEQPGHRAYNAAVTDQPQVDESPWAETVASALGVELRTVALDAGRWRAGFVGAVLHNEQPLIHESSVPMAGIAGLAHADGVKVLLSGEGADELLGGYAFLNVEAARDFAAQDGVLREAARSVRRERQRRRAVRAGAQGDGHPGEFAHGVELSLAALGAYSHHRGARRRYEAGLLIDLRVYLPHLLNRQDKNTMQRSIETRVPFLDPDVVELAVNLPLEARVQPERKGILRDIGARVLPPEIAARPKVGFGFDIDRYVEPGLRPEFLADGRLREALGEPAEAWRARTAGLRGQRRMLALSAEILCRSFLDDQSPDAIEAALWH
jgi:asparagine synthase (glutamine-hydrolysing)